MENCVAPGLDKFDILLEAVLSFVRVTRSDNRIAWNTNIRHFTEFNFDTQEENSKMNDA